MLRVLLVLVFSFFGCVNAGVAATFTLGDVLPEIALKDQHDKPLVLTDKVHLLVFSRDMAGSNIISEAFEALEAEKINKPLYFANIQNMPSLIAKYIAVPKMQGLPYAIGLDYDGKQTQGLSAREDQASLFILQQRKLEEVRYFDSSEQLVEALKQIK